MITSHKRIIYMELSAISSRSENFTTFRRRISLSDARGPDRISYAPEKGALLTARVRIAE